MSIVGNGCGYVARMTGIIAAHGIAGLVLGIEESVPLGIEIGVGVGGPVASALYLSRLGKRFEDMARRTSSTLDDRIASYGAGCGTASGTLAATAAFAGMYGVGRALRYFVEN